MGLEILITIVFMPFFEGLFSQFARISIFAPFSLKTFEERGAKIALVIVAFLAITLDVVSKVWLGSHLLGIGIMYAVYNLLGMFLPSDNAIGKYSAAYISFAVYSLCMALIQGLSIGERFGEIMGGIGVLSFLFSVLGTVVVLVVIDILSSLFRRESSKSVLKMK